MDFIFKLFSIIMLTKLGLHHTLIFVLLVIDSAPI